MKKLLIIAFSLLAFSSFGQNKQPRQQIVATRNFIRPYKYYTDKQDSAVKLAILSASDNLLDTPYGAVLIKYVELTAKGVVLQGSQGVFNCTGKCYQAWNNSTSNNTAFVIVADSVVRHPIVQQ